MRRMSAHSFFVKKTYFSVIIKKFAVSALWVQIKEILKIRAKMNEQMRVCPLTRLDFLGLGVARAN